MGASQCSQPSKPNQTLPQRFFLLELMEEQTALSPLVNIMQGSAEAEHSFIKVGKFPQPPLFPPP